MSILRDEDRPDQPTTPDDSEPRPSAPKPVEHTEADEAWWATQNDDWDDDCDLPESDPWTMGDQWEADGYFDQLYADFHAQDLVERGLAL